MPVATKNGSSEAVTASLVPSPLGSEAVRVKVAVALWVGLGVKRTALTGEGPALSKVIAPETMLPTVLAASRTQP